MSGGDDPPPGGGGGIMYLPRMARISYDYRNQMVKNVYTDYQEQSYVHSWHYDCFGRRFRKIVGQQPNGPATEWTTNGIAATGMQVRYIHGGRAEDAHWQVFAEYVGVDTSSSPALSATYVYGNYIDEALTVRRDLGAGPVFPGLPAFPTGNFVDFYFNQDDLFSTTSMAAGAGGIALGALYPSSPAYAAGDIVERYDYGDFGHPKIGGSWWHSSIGNSRMFTGRDWEPEIEFYYYRTRYMEPMWGRFTTRDMPGVWYDYRNLGSGTSYTASAPQRYADPFGLEGGRYVEPRWGGPNWIPLPRDVHGPPAPWKGPPSRGNCYRYACDDPGKPGEDHSVNPDGLNPTGYSCKDLRDGAKRDGMIDPVKECHSTDESCPEGYRKVAVVKQTKPGPKGFEDYHWFREERDGRWTHKPGDLPARDFDEFGRPILDPRLQPIRDLEGTPYDEFCGTLCVPIDGIDLDKRRRRAAP